MFLYELMMKRKYLEVIKFFKEISTQFYRLNLTYSRGKGSEFTDKFIKIDSAGDEI